MSYSSDFISDSFFSFSHKVIASELGFGSSHPVNTYDGFVSFSKHYTDMIAKLKESKKLNELEHRTLTIEDNSFNEKEISFCGKSDLMDFLFISKKNSSVVSLSSDNQLDGLDNITLSLVIDNLFDFIIFKIKTDENYFEIIKFYFETANKESENFDVVWNHKLEHVKDFFKLNNFQVNELKLLLTS